MSRDDFKPRSFYRVWRRIGTRWGDNDAYGHVNNVIYYSWFDTVVNAVLIEHGLLDIAAGDPIGLVVETGCRYARPLAYPQTVAVGLAVEHVGRSSVHYRLGVFGEEEADAAAEGRFVHVYVGRADRRPAKIPASWREVIEAISSN